jgi:lipopolysaccharide export system permease protein
MTTTDRYIIRTFVGSYVTLLAVGVGLYIFGDLLFNLDEFTENRALPVRQILANMADYYGCNLPLYYMQLGGVVMALAASFTFGMMLKNNEMTALVAAGLPLQRLAVPALLCSVVLVSLWMGNSEWLVPRLADKIARHHDDIGGTRVSAVDCVRDDHNAILSANELRAQAGWLKGVYIVEPPSPTTPGSLISADAAYYDPQRHTWRLERGARLLLGGVFAGGELGAPLQRQPLAEYAFTLTPEQILLRQSAQWAGLMSIRQMNALLQGGRLPNKPAIAKSRDIRFMQPLLSWILMLLVVPFFLTREPANVLIAGGKALLLGGLCFGFAFVAHSASVEGSYMRLATALPVLIFGPIAVLHMASVRT